MKPNPESCAHLCGDGKTCAAISNFLRPDQNPSKANLILRECTVPGDVDGQTDCTQFVSHEKVQAWLDETIQRMHELGL